MATVSSSSDEVPSKPFPFCNSKKFSFNPNSDYQDLIRKKKPKSKFKSESNKRRRHRRRHSSLSSSSDSESDHYSSRKRDKPKKRRRKKEKELAKSDKRKSQKEKTKKKKKKKRHDTPSASSSSPVRRHKSRKRRRSPSPSPSCSTCSSRGRSPSRDGHREEERLPKSPDVTVERWEERDKVIEEYDDYQSSRNDEREADAAGNYELGKTRLGSVVQSVNGDVVVMAEEKEKSIGVGNARLASVVGSVNYDMAVEEEESAGSGDSAGKDAVDLELILRQRALENLRKFRGGLSAIKESDKPAVDRRIGSSDEGGSIPNQPIEEHGYSDVKSLEQSQSGLSANKGLVGNRVTASSIDVGITANQVKKVQESTNRMVLSEQTTGAKVAQDKKLVAEHGSGKVRRSEVSVGDKKEAVKPAKEGDFQNPNSTETPKPTVSRTFSKPIEGGSKQNEAKLEESSDRLLSEQDMLAKVAKDKRLVTETGRDKAHMGPTSIGDGSIPPVSCPIKDDKNCKSNEPMVNSATGSEFEQKTFCRVRDGETVQVKYKVYIPKKTPALARRKLQR